MLYKFLIMLFYVIILVCVVLIGVIKMVFSVFENKIVRDHELGFVYKNDLLVDVVGPGKYYQFINQKLVKIDTTKPFQSRHELNLLLEFETIRQNLDVYLIADNEIAIVYKDNVFFLKYILSV